MAKENSARKRNASGDTKDKSSIPIDRGYAWVIAFACGILFCMIAGTFKCLGVLKIQIERQFPECPENDILWILSTCSIVSLFSGYAFTQLLVRTNHRFVGLLGSILCTIGVFMTAFSPNCHFMFFSMGTTYSLGTGGIMVVAFSAFATYFNKHKALAVGIVGSGSGLGGLALPRLMNYLFNNYSFQDSLIFYAGVYAQCIVLSALLRPITSFERKTKVRQREPDNNNGSLHNIKMADDQDTLLAQMVVEDEEKTSNLRSQTDSITTERLTDISSLSEPESYSMVEPSLRESSEEKSDYNEIFGSGYISQLAVPFSTSHHSLHEIDNPNKLLATETDKDTTTTSRSTKENQPPSQKYNCKLWCHPKVLLIGWLVFFAVSSINIVFTSAPSYGMEFGLEMDTITMIMSIAGGCEMIFRIFHGWFADRGYISALSQICIIMICSNVAAILCASLPGIVGISIIYAVMSFCGTSIYSLLPVVVIELIGKEHLATVLGIFYIYQALAFIISTVIATVIHSHFETWVIVFHYIGASYFVAAVLGIATFIYHGYTQRRKKGKKTLVTTLT